MCVEILSPDLSMHTFVMSVDPFPAAEKILADIENVFKRDKDLRDFEILPVTVGENKSPVLHAEHTLGLQQWCVRHLYLHVYQKLMNLKKQHRLRREDPTILSRLLLGGILLNPECTLSWNIRRELVVMGRLDPFSELHVSAVTLSRRPKAAEAFVYRRWILNRIIATPLEDTVLCNLLDEELRVSLMCADRYANNYHAWNHRMWVMSHLPKAEQMFLNEWTSSEHWVSSHVSEHSGLQYRQFLLKQLVQHLRHSEYCLSFHQTLMKFFTPLKNSSSLSFTCTDSTLSNRFYLMVTAAMGQEEPSVVCPIHCEQDPIILHTSLLAYELFLATELIHLYPGHEALWCHRRFIIFSFYSLAEEVGKCGELDITDGVPLPKTQKLSVLEEDLQHDILWRLVLWFDDNLLSECFSKSPEDCYQSKLAHRHRQWIDTILLSKKPVNFDAPGAS